MLLVLRIVSSRLHVTASQSPLEQGRTSGGCIVGVSQSAFAWGSGSSAAFMRWFRETTPTPAADSAHEPETFATLVTDVCLIVYTAWS